MAEMSFGPRLRPARGFDKKDQYLGIPGLSDPFAFLQGCVVSQVERDNSPAIVQFPNAPAKMLAVVLPDYGPASNMRVQLCDLPRLPGGKLRATEMVVEVHSASINPTDWKQRKGILSSLCKLTLPTILGIDFSGTPPTTTNFPLRARVGGPAGRAPPPHLGAPQAASCARGRRRPSPSGTRCLGGRRWTACARSTAPTPSTASSTRPTCAASRAASPTTRQYKYTYIVRLYMHIITMQVH
jgi:hypothetical protein